MRTLASMLLAVPILAAATVGAGAFPALPVPADAGATLVAQGCGWGGWRGPWGGCRYGYYGRPVVVVPGPVVVNPQGCPPGYWRGPWGHCRDTPYHGPLPGGGYRY